jgi:hypothetical protein
MTMKTMLLAAAAVLSLPVGAALAASPYNVLGNPVPFSAPATSVVAAPPSSDTGSQAYQGSAPGPALPVVEGTVLPTNGSDGIVQTANSLPPGFERGTAGLTQDQSVDRYLQAEAAQHQ